MSAGSSNVRPMSRAVLASQLAAEMPAGTHCGGLAWEQLEAQHYAAATPREAAEIVDLINTRFCSTCPALRTCQLWAETERYDGLAAGAAYKNGRAKPRTWTVPRAGRQKAS